MSTAFSHDLRKGRGFEHVMLLWVQRKYPHAVLMEGSFKEYDIDALTMQMECKYDRMSKKTQNIAIECEDRGKPSGIEATTATHWAICFHDKEWQVAVATTEVWRSLANDKPRVRGGDDFSTYMYLVPKDLLFLTRGVKVVPLSRISVRRTDGS